MDDPSIWHIAEGDTITFDTGAQARVTKVIPLGRALTLELGPYYSTDRSTTFQLLERIGGVSSDG